MEVCRSCDAKIQFGLTAKGKRMPIDPEPHPEGNITLMAPPNQFSPPQAIVLAADVLERERAKGTALYRSHFVTCPQAALHRRRR